MNECILDERESARSQTGENECECEWNSKKTDQHAELVLPRCYVASYIVDIFKRRST